MNTTRISLNKGVAVTRDIQAEEMKKELEAAAKAPLDTLKKVIETTEEEVAAGPDVSAMDNSIPDAEVTA